MTRRTLWLTFWLALPVATACDREPAPAAATMVRDSGGVTIVEVAAGAALAEWRVSEPLMVIGGPDDRAEYALFNAHHALSLPGGRVVVANRGTHELRYYDPTGQHVRSVGRRGGGPGEYENMWGLVALPGDSIGVWDWAPKRLTLYDAEGELGRIVSATGVEGLGPRMLGALPDGGVVLMAGMDPGSMFAAGGGTRETPISLLRLASDGSVVGDTLGPFPGEEQFLRVGEGRISMRRVPYGRAERIAVAAGRIHVGDDRTGEVRTYDPDGTLRRVVRRPHLPEPVTAEDISRYRETSLATVPDARRAAEREELDLLPAARTLPAFSDLFVDRLGRIWLMEFTRETEGPRTWTVHGADGVPAARLTLPRGFAPRDADDALLLAWSRDDLDVERITLHRIVTEDGS